jgi:hypothetical protein
VRHAAVPLFRCQRVGHSQFGLGWVSTKIRLITVLRQPLRRN